MVHALDDTCMQPSSFLGWDRGTPRGPLLRGGRARMAEVR